MIAVDFKIDIERAIKDMMLDSRYVDSAISRALNRAADAGRREAVNAITERTGESKEFVRGKTYVSGATPYRQVARIGALPSSSNVGLYRGANPKTVRRFGTNLNAWAHNQFYDKAFIAPGSTRRVVKRTGPGKGDMKGLWGPSVRLEFMRAPVTRRVLVTVYNRFAIELDRGLAFYLRGRK